MGSHTDELDILPWGGIRLPPELQTAIDEYLEAGKHGNITLNIKAGKIVSWAVTEIGRIDKDCNPPVD